MTTLWPVSDTRCTSSFAEFFRSVIGLTLDERTGQNIARYSGPAEPPPPTHTAVGATCAESFARSPLTTIGHARQFIIEHAQRHVDVVFAQHHRRFALDDVVERAIGAEQNAPLLHPVDEVRRFGGGGRERPAIPHELDAEK